jgi:hypothetical protein
MASQASFMEVCIGVAEARDCATPQPKIVAPIPHYSHT